MTNRAISLRNDGSQIHNNNSDKDIRQNNPFTTAQVQQLLKLLQESPNHSVNQIHSVNKDDYVIHHTKGKTNSYWILDTSSTDHITYDKNQFINFLELNMFS